MCRRKSATVRSGLFSAHLGRVLDVFGKHFRDLTKKVSPAAQYTSGGAFSSTFCVLARSRSGRTRQGRRSATTAARGNRGAKPSSRCARRRGAKPREPCPPANARPCRGERASGRGCALSQAYRPQNRRCRGEKRYRARCAVRGACRGAQCGACRGARLRRGEVVHPTISMMRYGCYNTHVENLASLSSVRKPLR